MLGEVSDQKVLSGFLARCPKFGGNTDFKDMAEATIRGRNMQASPLRPRRGRGGDLLEGRDRVHEVVEEARGSKLAIQKAFGIVSRFSSGGSRVSKFRVRAGIATKTLSEILSEILAEVSVATSAMTRMSAWEGVGI